MSNVLGDPDQSFKVYSAADRKADDEDDVGKKMEKQNKKQDE